MLDVIGITVSPLSRIDDEKAWLNVNAGRPIIMISIYSLAYSMVAAMSAALFGLVPGNAVTVDEPQVVRKSFPDFWNVWNALA